MGCIDSQVAQAPLPHMGHKKSVQETTVNTSTDSTYFNISQNNPDTKNTKEE